MNIVPIISEKPYEVRISRGLLQNIGKHVAAFQMVDKAVIITDSNVGPLYAKKLEGSFHGTSIQVLSYTISAGEHAKTPLTVTEILDYLVRNACTRNSLLIALGGGVVGDITGFAASIFLRGVRYVQVPTTLLAAVDASIGGKTAINLSAGKNLAGTIWQPSRVFCDPDVFDTLPATTVSEGMAEVIKYGFISDASLLERLYTESNPDIEQIVCRCVELKGQFIAEDERDNGVRKALNFGHTIGHGYEWLSDYSIPHGAAVAMGMVCELGIGEMEGITPAEERKLAAELLARYNLRQPLRFEVDKMLGAICHDKKNTSEGVGFVMIPKCGSYRVMYIPYSRLAKRITQLKQMIDSSCVATQCLY